MVKTSIKVVTQNVFFSKRLKKLVKFINDQRADVYCLQEIRGVKVADKISQNSGYFYLISEEIKAVYKYKFNNLILTNLIVLESGELKFYRKNKVRGSHEDGRAFWATLNKEEMTFRIYNCHLNVNGIHPQQRLRLLQKIIKHSQKFKGPIIICGDMNTVLPGKPVRMWIVKWLYKIPLDKDEFLKFRQQRKNETEDFYRMAKKYGFEETAEIHKNTWVFPFTRWGVFGLKLDWMLYKGFVKNHHVLAQPIGDHKAIIGKFSVK